MSDIIHAPWTDEQVEALQAWQDSPSVHSYTCEKCRDRDTEREEAQRMNLPVVVLELEDEVAEGDVLPPYDGELPALFVAQEHDLVPTVDGWVCLTCDYTQDWAHVLMFQTIPEWGVKKIRRKKPAAEPPEELTDSQSV